MPMPDSGLNIDDRSCSMHQRATETSVPEIRGRFSGKYG